MNRKIQKIIVPCRPEFSSYIKPFREQAAVCMIPLKKKLGG